MKQAVPLLVQELDGSLGASTSIQLPDSITSSTSLELYLRLSCNGAQRLPCVPDLEQI